MPNAAANLQELARVFAEHNILQSQGITGCVKTTNNLLMINSKYD